SVEAGDEVTAMETGEPEEPAAALVQREHEAGRLHDRQGDGEVTGPLRDLLLTALAFVLPLLQLRDHDAEQLHDDRRRDVRHDPEEEDRHVRDRAAREQVEEADDAGVLRLVLKVLDRGEVDERDREVGADPVDAHDDQREQDLVAQVGHPEHVPQAGEHGERDLLWRREARAYRLVRAFPLAGGRRRNGSGRRSVRPPAASIARVAAAENACARTVSAFVSSPRPRTFTRPCLATRPRDRSVPGSTSVPASNAPSTSRFTTAYSTRNGFLNPFAFGVRRVIGV